MKRLQPQSLLSRAFWLIVVLTVVTLLTSLAVFIHAQQEPRTKQMAQLVVSVVNLTRAAVLSSAPEWRGALLAELADSEGLQVQLADSRDELQPLPEHPPELRQMVERVRHSLDRRTRFASERNGVEALWVSFFIGDEEFWLALPRERVEHPFSQVLLAWGGMVLVLSLLGAFLIARQVAAPLKRLAQAARKVGQGEMPDKLPEQGVQEVIAVSAAFNQMSADLAANERERALVLAGISHDLRTPLSRVRLAAEMSGDAFLRDGLILDVEQMDAVIGQFLDFARLDGNEAAVEADVAALVSEVAQRFSPAASALRLDLKAVPAMVVRPVLLGRALANLLDNAIKYGGGDITVQLREEAGRVTLAVLDRGPGIAEDRRDAVKRPFVRLDAARSDVTGSGLGLAIVERAARLHHGEFRLDGRDGGGLAAMLVLPR
ncbi:MAG: ATP-binding protein [Gallionella sp.]|nr:ATP-binding protein [Gallionella sp.]MDD4946619.1 ATP-binding protein [Gallionella sp.]MDD5612796.1 ATP-binding protein [Gallionella sp.]